jgi:hypothetical protein
MERLNTAEDYTKPSVQHLSKKQLNKLEAIGSRIPVMNEGSAEPMNQDELAHNLKFFKYVDTFVNSGHTNTKRPQLIEAILGKSPKERRSQYIAGVGGVEDYMGIVAATTDVLTEEKPIVFRMVYGATEQASLRSLGYPIPAMQAMRRVAQVSDIPSYLQIIFANTISAGLNELDRKQVESEQQLMTQKIGEVATTLGVSDVTGFYDDSLVDLSRIPFYVEALTGELSAEQIETLLAKERSTDLTTSLGYVAAHYAVHDNPRQEFQHLSYATVPHAGSSSIIDVGGKQEEYFLRMRRLIDYSIGETLPRDPFVFTRHGVPPYYMARDGDVSLREYESRRGIVDATNIGTAAMHDLEFMSAAVCIPGQISKPVQIPYGMSLHV